MHNGIALLDPLALQAYNLSFQEAEAKKTNTSAFTLGSCKMYKRLRPTHSV
jgi:hypothetical protein